MICPCFSRETLQVHAVTPQDPLYSCVGRAGAKIKHVPRAQEALGNESIVGSRLGSVGILFGGSG